MMQFWLCPGWWDLEEEECQDKAAFGLQRGGIKRHFKGTPRSLGFVRAWTGTLTHGAEPEVLEIRDQAFLIKAGTPQVFSKQIQPGEGRSQAQILNRGPGGTRVIL